MKFDAKTPQEAQTLALKFIATAPTNLIIDALPSAERDEAACYVLSLVSAAGLAGAIVTENGDVEVFNKIMNGLWAYVQNSEDRQDQLKSALKAVKTAEAAAA